MILVSFSHRNPSGSIVGAATVIPSSHWMQARCTAAQALTDPWIENHGDNSEVPLDVGVVQRLAQYSDYNRVKHEVLLRIARRCGVGELRDLQWQFGKMDTDGDGVLTLQEMTEALKAVRTGGHGERVYSDEEIRTV